MPAGRIPVPRRKRKWSRARPDGQLLRSSKGGLGRPFSLWCRADLDRPPGSWSVMERPKNSAAWILSVATRSKCPRCGKGKLFDGFLKLAPRCEVCGLDYSFADTADGPAFFAMMGMAVPVTAFGIWLELTHEP